jgi:hypothetical protein
MRNEGQPSTINYQPSTNIQYINKSINPRLNDAVGQEYVKIAFPDEDCGEGKVHQPLTINY